MSARAGRANAVPNQSHWPSPESQNDAGPSECGEVARLTHAVRAIQIEGTRSTT